MNRPNPPPKCTVTQHLPPPSAAHNSVLTAARTSYGVGIPLVPPLCLTFMSWVILTNSRVGFSLTRGCRAPVYWVAVLTSSADASNFCLVQGEQGKGARQIK